MVEEAVKSYRLMCLKQIWSHFSNCFTFQSLLNQISLQIWNQIMYEINQENPVLIQQKKLEWLNIQFYFICCP